MRVARHLTMLIVFYLVLLAAVAFATTVPTSLQLGVSMLTENSYAPLPRTTPVIRLGYNDGPNINVYGISSASAQNGDTVFVIRTGFNGNLVFYDESASVANEDKIRIPGVFDVGLTLSMAGRSGAEFVYYNSRWYMVGYT